MPRIPRIIPWYISKYPSFSKHDVLKAPFSYENRSLVSGMLRKYISVGTYLKTPTFALRCALKRPYFYMLWDMHNNFFNGQPRSPSPTSITRTVSTAILLPIRYIKHRMSQLGRYSMAVKCSPSPTSITRTVSTGILQPIKYHMTQLRPLQYGIDRDGSIV